MRRAPLDRVRVAVLGPLETGAGDVGGGRLRTLLPASRWTPGASSPRRPSPKPSGTTSSPPTSRNALQSLVSRLRRSLGDGALVEQAAGGYRLALDPDDVDALHFDRLAATGSAALHAGRARARGRDPAAGIAGSRVASRPRSRRRRRT
jgi:hypothetical protein